MFSVFGPYFLEENNQVEVYTHNNISGGIAPGIRIEQSMHRGSIPHTDNKFFSCRRSSTAVVPYKSPGQ